MTSNVCTNECIFDLETDNLLDSLTKLHVFSWKLNEEPIKSTADPGVIREVMTQEDTLYIGHNIIQFDLPALRKLNIVDVPWTKCADTLGLSWVLFPERQRHGLAHIGEEHGVKKPEIGDWVGLTYEDYAHRCQEDVMINWLEWKQQKKRLKELYG